MSANTSVSMCAEVCFLVFVRACGGTLHGQGRCKTCMGRGRKWKSCARCGEEHPNTQQMFRAWMWTCGNDEKSVRNAFAVGWQRKHIARIAAPVEKSKHFLRIVSGLIRYIRAGIAAQGPSPQTRSVDGGEMLAKYSS